MTLISPSKTQPSVLENTTICEYQSQRNLNLETIGQKSIDIAWAAGLFEGEGTIYFNKARSIYRIGLKMTDEDVMEKFFKIAEIGNLYGPYTPKEKKLNGENKKDFWLWQCWQPSEVSAFLKMLLPYFGKRRAAKTIEALSYENIS